MEMKEKLNVTYPALAPDTPTGKPIAYIFDDTCPYHDRRCKRVDCGGCPVAEIADRAIRDANHWDAQHRAND